jgi:hypothetical protein
MGVIQNISLCVLVYDLEKEENEPRSVLCPLIKPGQPDFQHLPPQTVSKPATLFY